MKLFIQLFPKRAPLWFWIGRICLFLSFLNLLLVLSYAEEIGALFITTVLFMAYLYCEDRGEVVGVDKAVAYHTLMKLRKQSVPDNPKDLRKAILAVSEDDFTELAQLAKQADAEIENAKSMDSTNGD